MTITQMTATALCDALAAGQLSSSEIARAFLAQIGEKEPAIGAYLTVTAQQAMEQAGQIDRRRARGEALPPLAGLPGAIKDNICTRLAPTTCASRMLEHFTPPYDATVMEKLIKTGFVLLGKTNMDEFAMGSTTENSAFHPTHNPCDPTRVPGGSSGGSAAAVAAGEAPFALGSDTGGSIRQPAAFCGVVGMKPTYGAVSRYGLVAFASSLDQIGPLTRDVRDSALILSAIAGPDPRDATCDPSPRPDYSAKIGREIAGLRIALPEEYFSQGLHPEIKSAILAAAAQFERLGARVQPVSLPALRAALPAYYVMSSAEASSNLARFDGVKYGYRTGHFEDIDDLYCRSRSEGFGPEVKRRILLGTFALSAGYYDAYYKKALQVRTLLIRQLEEVFSGCDCILSPVAPTTAYPLGEKSQTPLEMYMGDVYTVPVNLAGVPALSLPCGQDSQGLPIGMQLIGRPFEEGTLYQLGYAFEQSRKEMAK